MNFKARLLGLAFAAADALVEVGADGCVALALGAGPSDEPAASWAGRKFSDLFQNGAAVARAARPEKAGRRSEEHEALIHCQDGRLRRCRVRAFSLPELAPSLSCALTYVGPAVADHGDTPAHLRTADDLMADTASRLLDGAPRSSDLAISFVTVPESDDRTPETERLIARTLQDASLDGAGAARISPVHYALLRLAGDARDVAAELNEAALRDGVTLDADESSAAIPETAPSLCVLRAMRFAIEGCLKDEGLKRPDLTFSNSLKQTLREAEGFRAMIRGRDFALHYQPIVDLETRAVHHFEALARFSDDPAPANRIHMAEELALIEGFDLAVVEKALTKMRSPGSGLLKVAVNVSAASLASDSYVDAVLRMTSANPRDRQRLTIEITETAALADVDAANRRIAALRGSGVTVCIDDFGVGAASFAYLQRLSVDAVKIDGGFVRELTSDPRAKTMIRTMVELCHSMGLSTIAEMVETEETAETLKSLGVGYGQGWLFGRPEAEPRTTVSAPLPVRRKGVVEAWG